MNDSIFPVSRWRVTMPRALPSITTRSSISQRGNIFTLPSRDLPAERLIRPEEQLLAGLAAAVERPLKLRAAEAARVEQAAVFAGERHALRDALVDDVDRHFGEPVDVGLAASGSRRP